MQNLTPHPINVIDGDTHQPSGTVARVQDNTNDGTYTVGTDIDNLPSDAGNVIVSRMVAIALSLGAQCPDGTNPHVVSDLVRDDNGNIVGAVDVIPVDLPG